MPSNRSSRSSGNGPSVTTQEPLFDGLIGAGERTDAVTRDIPFRARPEPGLLQAIGTRYGLDLSGPLTDLGGGHLNLHVPDPPGKGWVVRVFAPWTAPERLALVETLRRRLRQAGIPVPELLATVDGAAFTKVGGRLVEVDEYLSGRRMDEHRQLGAGMAMMGRVHTALSGSGHLPGPEPAYPNHIEPSQAEALALHLQRIVAGWPDPSPDEAAICNRAVELARLLAPQEARLARSWQLQYVHGDFWDNNVLFDAEDRVTAVLDLDFAGWRPRTDDVALTFYYATATPDREVVDQHQLEWLRECLDSYDASLERPLSRQERESIAPAMARTVLFMTRNIIGLHEDPTDYGAPALPAQRGMLAGMQQELRWSLQLATDPALAQRILAD